MRRSLAAILMLAWGAVSLGAAEARRFIVVCAPGYPGNTAAAQPTMDGLARAAEGAAAFPEGSLGAIYFETEQGGLARLAEPDAAIALVPLPFFFQHRARLRLKPELQVVQEGGATEVWSLLARKGRVQSPASLDGWEVTGIPGYAPAFVRGAVLGGWGALPATSKITFTSRPLSALRRAAAGESVAVLLDRAQSAGISSLPFAADLEVVARSKPLPGNLLCLVGDRLAPARSAPLLRGLLRLDQSDDGRAALKSLQMVRFQKVDPAALVEAQSPGR